MGQGKARLVSYQPQPPATAKPLTLDAGIEPPTVAKLPRDDIWEDADEIRARLQKCFDLRAESDKHSIAALAAEYGCHHTTIKRIWNARQETRT